MEKLQYLKQSIVGLVLLAVWGILGLASLTQAQTSCPYADMRLDTTLAVDSEAVCQAAKPWSEEGIRVFVFLTDERPPTEEAWFDLLDRIEAEVGLSDPGQGTFAKSALAIEASTATDIAWGRSVTFGENLFGTPLDTDAAVAKVKNDLRSGLVAGDPTGGLVKSLEGAYQTAFPPAATTAAEAPPVGTSGSSSPLGWVGVGVLVIGVLGGAGYFLTPRVIKPAMARRQRLKALQTHLAVLQSRTANLLAACDRLLEGEKPEETVLYQLFSAYGGAADDEMRAEVHEWLRRCQGALADAFDLRRRLDDAALEERRSLEDQVKDWELLYLTLAGSSERILTLTDNELRTLLDPLLTLDREEADDVKLTAQLDGIRRELEGMPLKVELMIVDPAQTDAEGILGYVDQVQGQIAFLQRLQEEAPERLAQVQARRETVAKMIPPKFILSHEALFGGIDERLTQAQTDLAQERMLSALEGAEETWQDLEVVEKLVLTTAEHKRLRAKIDAITALGYRPDGLTDTLQEIETDLETISEKITGGEYVAAGRWITELEADGQRALENTQAWQALEKQNVAALDTLKQNLDRVVAYQSREMQTAWQTLQRYSAPNWSDVGISLKQATQTLDLFEGLIVQLEQLNSLEVQQFAKVETGLHQAADDLTDVEEAFHEVVNRLGEVQAAEKHLSQAIDLAAAGLDQAKKYRDQEDRKIGPEVDQSLAQARRLLGQGRELNQTRNFIAAMEAVSEARDLATAAYATADEQVQKINDLQASLKTISKSATGKVGQMRLQVKGLPVGAKTDRTNKLAQQATDKLSAAKQAQTISADLEDQAWAKALLEAISAYEGVQRQADEALEDIKVRRDMYNKLCRDVEKEIRDARSTAKRAESLTKHLDAKGAGRKALREAMAALPRSPNKNASVPTLNNIRRKANEANKAAARAENQARQQIQRTRAARARPTVTWSGSPSTSSRPFSGSWSGSSRSSSSSRRRSSSMGSSSRSSSMGRRRRR